jgi:hypothetical protein
MNMDRKYTIGFDLDNTLIHMSVMKRISSELNLRLPEQSDWQFSEFPQNIRDRVFELFKDPAFMCEDVKPIWGSKAFLRRLGDMGHSLRMITARAKEVKTDTISLVREHFPQIETIQFVEPHETKREIMAENKLDFWIDDAPHEVINAIELGISTILVSNQNTRYNWKVKDDPRLLKVVSSVKDIELKTFDVPRDSFTLS